MRLQAPIALLALGPLFAAASFAAGPAPVRLVQPRAGAVLSGGGSAVVEWAPRGAGLEALDGRVDEWEAFLSFDGGRSYPVRVSPHLDIDLRRFRFDVPAIASDDARIMLRFGDERREVGFEMPLRFSIAPPASVAPAARLAGNLRGSAGPSPAGEAARPGDRGVALWLEGTRRGAALRWRTSSAPEIGAGRGWIGRRLLALLLGPPQSGGPFAFAVARSAAALPGHPVAGALDAPSASACLTSLLLLVQRRNE